MAARCGMPREHPVIINTRTGEVFASGFFPKFENNDDHKASFIEKATRAKSLTVSRKWSGYLSGIKIFRRRDGSFGFIVTSKKSADETVYVREGRKLWESMLDQETLRIIYESGVDSLWAKTLTKKDQVHGNVVRIETIVITGAGKILKKGDKRPQTIGDNELFDLLKSVGLEEYAAVPVHIPKNLIVRFVTAVQNNRDFMTEHSFQEILKSHDLNFSSRHKDVVGNRLKGLIFKFYFEGETPLTLKCEFPGYTSITRCLRAYSDGHLPTGIILKGKWMPTPNISQQLNDS